MGSTGRGLQPGGQGSPARSLPAPACLLLGAQPRAGERQHRPARSPLARSEVGSELGSASPSWAPASQQLPPSLTSPPVPPVVPPRGLQHPRIPSCGASRGWAPRVPGGSGRAAAPHHGDPRAGWTSDTVPHPAPARPSEVFAPASSLGTAFFCSGTGRACSSCAAPGLCEPRREQGLCAAPRTRCG